MVVFRIFHMPRIFWWFFSLDVSQVNPQVGRPVCYKPTLIRKLTSEITFSCVFRLVCFHVFFWCAVFFFCGFHVCSCVFMCGVCYFFVSFSCWEWLEKHRTNSIFVFWDFFWLFLLFVCIRVYCWISRIADYPLPAPYRICLHLEAIPFQNTTFKDSFIWTPDKNSTPEIKFFQETFWCSSACFFPAILMLLFVLLFSRSLLQLLGQTQTIYIL